MLRVGADPAPGDRRARPVQRLAVGWSRSCRSIPSRAAGDSSAAAAAARHTRTARASRRRDCACNTGPRTPRASAHSHAARPAGNADPSRPPRPAFPRTHPSPASPPPETRSTTTANTARPRSRRTAAPGSRPRPIRPPCRGWRSARRPGRTGLRRRFRFIHWITLSAFSIVSVVVKVLLATTSNVASASNRSNTSSSAAPSTLLTTATSYRSSSRPSASTSKCGPSADPPMPTCSTWRIGPSAPSSIASISARIRAWNCAGARDHLGLALAALGGVPDRAVLGRVDMLAAEQRLALAGQVHRLGDRLERRRSHRRSDASWKNRNGCPATSTE